MTRQYREAIFAYACWTYCHQDQGEEEDSLSCQQSNYEKVGYCEMVCVNSGAYETYSLSAFVIRTSASLPRRPTRMTLDTSTERDGVDEKACGRCEDG